MIMSHKANEEEELRQKIEEVKKRFPYHSVQPYLIQELEELEEKLEKFQKQEKGKQADL
jgi:hypothetical protein